VCVAIFKVLDLIDFARSTELPLHFWLVRVAR